jgi:hypothetical protein
MPIGSERSTTLLSFWLTEVLARWRRHGWASKAELKFLDDAIKLTTSALDANRVRLRSRSESGTAEAVASFFAKGWKSIQALRRLAVDGYGEDALILRRSLTNTAIDMAFITQTDTEERLSHWVAAGRVARRRLAEATGSALPDEEGTDWSVVEAEAAKWSGRNIRQRAEAASVRHLYALMYRFGSGFEHPDAWMMSGFITKEGSAIAMRIEPSSRYVDSALVGSAICLSVLLGCLAHALSFDANDQLRDLERLIASHPANAVR